MQENNPAGIAFTCEREEQKEGNLEIAICKLKATNLPQNQKFHLEGLSFGESVFFAPFPAPNESGDLVQKFSSKDHVKGAPYTFYLCSEDGKQCVAAKFVPFPLESIGKDGSRVSLEYLSRHAYALLFQLQGFKPHEKVVFKTQFLNKEISTPLSINEHGEFLGVIRCSQSKIEDTSGHSKIEIERNDETLVLEYDWGKRLPFPLSLTTG